MAPSRHFGLLGGLGVGATVIYYQGLTAACVAADREPCITIAHAHRFSAHAIVRRGLALSPEGWRLFFQQSVDSNLLLGATPLADKTKISHLLDRVYTTFPRLAERRLHAGALPRKTRWSRAPAS